jgi:hypothetical protein
LLELLSFGVRDFSQVGEGHGRTGELVGHSRRQFGLVWVNRSAFVINVREVLPALVARFSHLFLLLNNSLVLLTLRHLEEYVEKAKCAHHEHHKEVHDLECKITLFFQIVPLISNLLNLSILQRLCGLSALTFGHRWFVSRRNVERKCVHIDVFFSFVRLSAILKSLGFNSVSSLFVHLEFEDGSTFRVNIITLQINDLINGIEMNGDIFWHMLCV